MSEYVTINYRFVERDPKYLGANEKINLKIGYKREFTDLLRAILSELSSVTAPFDIIDLIGRRAKNFYHPYLVERDSERQN